MSTPRCTASMSGTVNKVISKLTLINPNINQKLFKISKPCNEETSANEEDTCVFQTVQVSMPDVPMEVDRRVDHGDQDQGATGAQLPTHLRSNQVPAPGFQGISPPVIHTIQAHRTQVDKARASNSHLQQYSLHSEYTQSPGTQEPQPRSTVHSSRPR